MRVQAVCASGASALVDESRGTSLVVVGSKGQGGLSRVLLGSVAQQVMRHAECPVAVILSPEPWVSGPTRRDP